MAALARIHKDFAPGRLGDSTEGDQDIEGQFQSIVYQQEIQRIAVSFQSQQQAAALGFGEGEESVAVSSEQLSFEFFFESKTEHVALFEERTGAVGETLGDGSQAAFVATSERIVMEYAFF